MPIFEGSSLTTRKVNRAMSLTFFSRAKKWLFPRLTRSYLTTSLDEPHAIGGAFPPMKIWSGGMPSSGMPSWKLEIPNLIAKALLEIRRNEIEADQSDTLLRYADQAGVVLADLPDQLLFKRIMSGGLTSSVTTSQFGKTYTQTMDGLPMFGTNHQLDGVTSQSNEIQGNLGASTVAGITSQDVGQTAQQLQKDLGLIAQYFQTVKNDKNMPIWPTMDLAESIVLVGPPCLAPAFALAFRAAGSIVGGSSGGSNGSSTSIGPMFVKDAITSGYLAGFNDPESPTNAMILPPTQGSYYAFVVNDYVAPFYLQLFKPQGGDGFPPGYDVKAVVNAAMKEARALGVEYTREQASLFASTIVEHNLGAVGANAQWETVTEEKFFISPRSRLNAVYGPWITALRIDPAGTSGGVY
jgi:hypothetical protein